MTWGLVVSIRGLVVGCILAFSGGAVLADSFVYLDFDNVTLESRRVRKGTFATPYRVFRVEQRENAAQPVAPAAEFVDLHPWDWDRLASFLAKGPGQLGSVSRVDTLQDGTKFKPGYYMASNPDSFLYFLEASSSDGEGHLLRNIREAYQRDPQKHFLGMAWPIVKLRFSDPATARTTGFLSARGHSQKEWGDALSYLWQQEAIPYAPDLRNVHGASRAEYFKFDVRWRIPHIKAGTLSALALEIARLPLTDADIRISPDGQGTEKRHSLVFLDDNQTTIQLVSALFERLAMSRRYPIKFVIGNLGLASEVRQSRRPQFYVITKYGKHRPAKPIEVFGEPAGWDPQTLPVLATKPCRQELSDAGGER